jgi:molecular chaperone IbpA
MSILIRSAIPEVNLSDFLRTSIGFNQQFRDFEQAKDGATSYPPYNIVQEGENSYKVVLAVAGFAKEELSVVFQNSTLEVSGEQSPSSDEGVVFVHKGIATRKFTKKLQTSSHVKVAGASYKSGLLTVRLVHEIPEEARIHRVTIE